MQIYLVMIRSTAPFVFAAGNGRVSVIQDLSARDDSGPSGPPSGHVVSEPEIHQVRGKHDPCHAVVLDAVSDFLFPRLEDGVTMDVRWDVHMHGVAYDSKFPAQLVPDRLGI